MPAGGAEILSAIDTLLHDLSVMLVASVAFRGVDGDILELCMHE